MPRFCSLIIRTDHRNELHIHSGISESVSLTANCLTVLRRRHIGKQYGNMDTNIVPYGVSSYY